MWKGLYYLSLMDNHLNSVLMQCPFYFQKRRLAYSLAHLTSEIETSEDNGEDGVE